MFRSISSLVSQINSWNISLKGWTLLYLGLPVLGFFIGQFHFWSNIFLIGIVGCFLWSNQGRIFQKDQGSLWEIKELFPGLFTVGILFLWVLFSGSGHFFLTSGDYLKHNAILYELINHQWPVSYTFSSQSESGVFLHYYVANYVIPAFLGKLLGFDFALRSVLIWNFLGVLLATLWLHRCLGKFYWWVIPLFIFFSGQDILGTYIFGNGPQKLGDHIEWWSGFAQYSSMTTLLWWVPQHAIPAWILTGMFLHHWFHSEGKEEIILFYSLSALWSPFVMFGLLPLVALCFFDKFQFKKWVSWGNFLGLIIFTCMGLFYVSGALAHRQGWIWQMALDQVPQRYTSFIVIEFMIWMAISLPLLILGKSKEKILWIITILCLSFIPLFIFGMYNDWCMRVSIVGVYCVFILAIKSLLAFKDSKKRNVLFGIWGLIFVLGIPTPFNEIYRTFEGRINPGPFVGGIDQLPMEIVTAQYLGLPAGPFYKYLVRKPEEKPQVLRPGVWKVLKENHLPLWNEYFEIMPK